MEEEHPFIELRKISKFYPGVRALEDVDFSVQKGEVHVLLGENGAGKSTLVKIITGATQKDDGEIFINGEKVEILNPKHAKSLGISVIYQELSLLPNLDVGQNIFLGKEPIKNKYLGTIDWKTVYENTQENLERWGLSISPKTKIRELGIAQQQMIEIIKALYSRAELILMDEPTSALTKDEVRGLLTFISKLKKEKVAIIYISHKLEEAMEIGDRVTVLRNGKKVETCNISETNSENLIQLMTGKFIKNEYSSGRKFDYNEDKEEILRVEGLSEKNALNNISFCLHKGEILGITGLLGAGKSELARVLFGIDTYQTGQIFIEGKKVQFSSPREAVKNGIAFLPEDRKQLGLVLSLSVKDNIILPVAAKLSRFGVLNSKESYNLAFRYISTLRIKTPSIHQKVGNLSGGNQQKVCLAKWLATKAKILIFDEPTRGIDVGAKSEIYSLMIDLALQGISIIVFSSEFPEVMRISDRILVLYRGKINGELLRTEATEEKIFSYAVGENSVVKAME